MKQKLTIEAFNENDVNQLSFEYDEYDRSVVVEIDGTPPFQIEAVEFGKVIAKAMSQWDLSGKDVK